MIKSSWRALFLTVLVLSLPKIGFSADSPSSRDSAGSEEARFNSSKEEYVRDDTYSYTSYAKNKRDVIRTEEPSPVSTPPPVNSGNYTRDDSYSYASGTGQTSQAPAAEPVSSPGVGPRFLVTEVRFTGNLSLSDAELKSLVTGIFNKQVTLAEVQSEAKKIKNYYRQKGYLAAYAYVPPQDIKEGVLRIDVMEGRLGQTHFTGNTHFSSQTLERALSLQPGEVLKYDKLRRSLVRLNRHPDIETKASLGPGPTMGTANVNVQVEEKKPYHISLSADNSGTENTGEERYGVSASHTNVSGRLDTISGRVRFGEETTGAGISYEMPLREDWGTRLGYSYSYTDVAVKGIFTPLNIEGDSQTHSLYMSHPLLEWQNLDLILKAGFDHKSVENRLLGNISGRDELRIFYGGFDLNGNDRWGRTLSTHTFNFGVPDIFGGSAKNDARASRRGTGGDFFVYRGYLTRFQKMIGELGLVFRGAAQLSSDNLTPSEQFHLGGASSIRGYQEGEYLGDYGVRGSADLYVPVFPESWRLPWSEESLRKQIQLVGFLDVGTATLRSPFSGEEKHKTLAGIGAGLRMHLYENFYGRVEWGFPIGDEAIDHRNSAFYFTVAYEVI